MAADTLKIQPTSKRPGLLRSESGAVAIEFGILALTFVAL